MITYVTGSLYHSPAQVLVNTVNTVGVMGKGIAFEFKRVYPEMFKQYREMCERGKFQVGDLWLYKSRNKWVLNFPTKKHWRSPSRPDYVESGLKRFRQVYAEWGIHSIAFPALGCGNGELDFETQARPLMERYLHDMPIDIFIYPDRDDPYPPEHVEPEKFRQWLRTQPEALAFAEVWDDIRDLLAKQDVFRTVARGNQFEAKIAPGQDGIKVVASGHSYVIEKEILLTFWQQLRDYGFSMRKIAPGVDRELSYIIPMFSELPYVKLVKLADRSSELRDDSPVGLQYVPGLAQPSVQAAQLPLFEFK